MTWPLVVAGLQLAGIPVAASVSPSKRLLALCFTLLFPGAGIALAWITCRTRGGKVAGAPEDAEQRHRLSSADVRRLGESPASLERLMSSDPSERLAALVVLSSTADANAVALLKWAVEHGPPDAVLDAALCLEDLGLRAEGEVRAARDAFEEEPTFATAIGAGDTAARAIFRGLIDGPLVGTMVDDARQAYEYALALRPTEDRVIHERLARLSMAATNPKDALERLARLSQRHEGSTTLQMLRDEAAFAARDFNALSYRPYAPARLALA